MKFLKIFLRGIVAGIGGVAPGLSGSVLLVILGLYENTVNAIGTLFLNFKKNVLFLIPLVAGIAVGLWASSNIINFFLKYFEFQTLFLFLGMVIGTLPLFYREVKKNGFRKRYYFVIAAAAAAGLFLFGFNKNLFPVITEPTWWQSVLLGVAVAGSSIIPGVDSAALLSAFGLYELYRSSLSVYDWQVLIPAAIGIAVSVLVISPVMNFLIKKAYTATFSVTLGLFISVIPKVLNEKCAITNVGQGVVAVILTVVGFCVSFYLGDIKGNNERLRKCFAKRK